MRGPLVLAVSRSLDCRVQCVADPIHGGLMNKILPCVHMLIIGLGCDDEASGAMMLWPVVQDQLCRGSGARQSINRNLDPDMNTAPLDVGVLMNMLDAGLVDANVDIDAMVRSGGAVAMLNLILALSHRPWWSDWYGNRGLRGDRKYRSNAVSPRTAGPSPMSGSD